MGVGVTCNGEEDEVEYDQAQHDLGLLALCVTDYWLPAAPPLGLAFSVDERLPNEVLRRSRPVLD